MPFRQTDSVVDAARKLELHKWSIFTDFCALLENMKATVDRKPRSKQGQCPTEAAQIGRFHPLRLPDSPPGQGVSEAANTQRAGRFKPGGRF